MHSSETIWLTEVDSTNRFALDNFDCFDSGTLIAAARQSAGRGSKGRVWLSPPDVNVYASLILKDFPFAPHQAAWLASLAVLEVLRTAAPRLNLAVKWPNDILCGHKKIAGILCEAKNNGIVIGIGLNVNMDQDDVTAIGRDATSLYLETGVRQDDVGAFASNIRNVALRLLETARLHGIGGIHAAWKAENYLDGRRISVRLADGTSHDGPAVDFTLDGTLVMVDEASGEILTIASCDLLSY